MDLEAVPGPLRARLGDAASAGLLDLFDRAHREGRIDVINACSDRFERRLSEETAAVRVQIAQSEASLRAEIAQLGAALRQEMAAMGGSLRQEIAAMGGSLRQEMASMGGSLRQETATGRFELLKWCFLFWIGQVLVMSTIIGVMLRIAR